MSKFKRVTSGLVGVAMAASMFTSMPFSVFAEDKTETTNQPMCMTTTKSHTK